MNINFDYYFNILKVILLVFLLTYIVNFVLFLNVSKNVMGDKTSSNYELLFIDYSTIFTKKNKKVLQENSDIKSSFILKAIYAKSETTGWVIIKSIKSDEKSVILEQNNMFNGYKLIRFYQNYVVLEKNNLEYKLSMNVGNRKKTTAFTEQLESKNNIIQKENKVIIKRKTLNNYLKNKVDLYNQISIQKINKEGKLYGFQIINIQQNSVFEKLNLEEGDILHSINHENINNYNAILNLYKNINKINVIIIKLERKNKKMEFTYEIN